MASVTKNPVILQSANYIYSWFQSKLTNSDDVQTFSGLEVVESDKYIVDYIDKTNKNKNSYENVKTRLNAIEELLNEDN
jgi:hypothetical protein